MEFVGQGRVSISTIGADRFSVNRVRPKAIIEFKRDNAGKTIKFNWIQPLPKVTLTRIAPITFDSSSNQPQGNLSKYTGNYRLNGRQVFKVREEKDHLTSQSSNEGKFILTQVSDNRFVLVDGELKLEYNFIPDKNGGIQT